MSARKKMTELLLNTTREEPSEQDKIKIMQFKIDLMEQDYKLLQDELARVCEDLEKSQMGRALESVQATRLQAERDKLREELESARRIASEGDIWVAFASNGMPYEVCRQTFEPHINPRVGRWVRCVQSERFGVRE